MPNPRITARAAATALALLLLVLPIRPAAAQAATWHSYCSTEADGTAYFSSAFDTGLNGKARVATGPIEREFTEYLKGQFGYHSNAPHAVNCARLPSADAAATALDGLKTQAQSQGKKVVEVGWTFVPDTAQVSISNDFSRQGEGRSVEFVGKFDHGYCVSEGIGGPQYVSAVFAPEVFNLSQWLNAFDKFLRSKYGFTGNGADPAKINPVACNSGWAGGIERLIKARSDGARAGGRKVIETGWKPGGAPAAAPAAAKDDDKEPPPAPPPPPPPSADVRKAATDEGPAVLALCQNDRLIEGTFDCYAVQRAIYGYRIAHAGSPPEPLQDLFMGEKVDCSGCLKTNFLSMWAANRAMSNGFSGPKSGCVGTKFEAAIKAAPYPHRVKDLFEAAMKACPK